MSPKTLTNIDNGRTCGIYLVSLGVVIFLSTLFRGILLENLQLVLLPLLFFVGGRYLTKHKKMARKWVLGISIFYAIAALVFAIIVPLIGAENIKINLLIYQKKGPSLAMAYVTLLVVFILALIPILLLYNDKARQEFTN